jgi:hypothetical protein
VAQPVRVEALEAKQLGPSHQRPVQRVVGEPSAAIAQPQGEGVGQRVLSQCPQVAVQRSGGLRAERHDTI